MIGQNRRLVNAPVAIGIFQQFDSAVLSLFRLFDRLVTGSDPPYLLVELTCLVQLHHVEVAFQVVSVDFANQDPPFASNAMATGSARYGSLATNSTWNPGGVRNNWRLSSGESAKGASSAN